MTYVFYITTSGKVIAERLKGLFPEAEIIKFSKSCPFERIWLEAKNLIFIMATGIVVRTISPFLKDKKSDPAVVVMDEKGRFVISLMGGHLGGANKLAKEIARYIGAEPVITTSSDIHDHTALDLWAKEQDLVIENPWRLPSVATRLINRGFLKVYVDKKNRELPEDLLEVSDPLEADVIITNRIDIKGEDVLYLRPRNLILGIGCNSGTDAEEIEEAVKEVLERHALSFNSINSIATIVQKVKERGIVKFAEKYGFPIKGFTSEELNSVSYVGFSEEVYKAVGARAVSEPAALLASGSNKLLIPKQKFGNVTIAVAELERQSKRWIEGQRRIGEADQESSRAVGDYGINISTLKHCSGTTLLRYCSIYIIGTGPGDLQYLTQRAKEAIMSSDVIVGYSTYIDLIKDIIKDKEVVSTPMTQEIDRAEKAVDLALSRKTVSVISGGDPGIYGMAGLVFEILKRRESELKDVKLKVEIIPGISAINACAARLGAPIMHDFAVISLSDRLTDWQIIEERLIAAARADFVTVLFNPRSKGRPGHIKRAVEIFLQYRSPETPVGIVRSAMRTGERVIISTLKDIPFEEIDMQTTVIIGNSSTYVWNGWMITPRGYERKFK